jgi:hypothetical protein
MEAPYHGRLFEFRAYRDFLAAVPAEMRKLPVYITETDQNERWADQNSGWVQAAYYEVDQWNQRPGSQKIQTLVLYRWKSFDQWGIEHKPGVIQDFRAAVARSYLRPQVEAASAMSTTYLPMVHGGAAQSAEMPREWDARLELPAGRPRARLVQAQPKPGEVTWRLVEAKWFDKEEAKGKTQVFVEVLDELGQRVVGQPVRWWWAQGMETKRSEEKPKHDYSLNFDMYNPAPSYSVEIADGVSDRVEGLGLGDLEAPEYNVHTAYRLVFQRVTAVANEQASSNSPQPVPASVGELRAQASPLDPLVLEALIAVESGGTGFWEGRLKIRLEAHLLLSPAYGNPAAFQPFFRFNRDNILEAEYRPDARAAWIAYHAGQENEWGAFQVARMIDADAAIRCTSMGLGQVMGFHWQALGYGSPMAMLAAMQRSEAAQLVAMVNYILARPALVAAINGRDWETITRLYNGVGLEHIYTPRLIAAYAKLGGKKGTTNG